MSDDPVIVHPRLIVLTDPCKRSEIALSMTGEFIEIGRDTNSALRISDPLTSGNHCALRCEGDDAMLHDRKRRNGTFVNKQFWPKKRMAHGDRLLVRSTIIIYLEGEGSLDALPFLD